MKTPRVRSFLEMLEFPRVLNSYLSINLFTYFSRWHRFNFFLKRILLRDIFFYLSFRFYRDNVFHVGNCHFFALPFCSNLKMCYFSLMNSLIT